MRKQQRISALLVLSPIVLLTGCMHRVAGTFRLQNTSGYALLIPPIQPNTENATIQTSLVNLGSIGRNAPSNTTTLCSIEGATFSLHPPASATSALWSVSSPSIRGWETDAGQLDLHAAWSQFTRDLSRLYRTGCFSAASRPMTTLRAITEAIPIPADEPLLFTYSFTGKGAIDLAPGMQVRVEQSILKELGQKQTVESVEAHYEVVSTPAGGVALHLSKSVNRRFAQGESDLFDLGQITHGSPMLRLFLQSVSDQNIKRDPILVAADTTETLEKATQQIEANDPRSCAGVPQKGISCTPLTSGVSLMISCDVNGKLVYRALGTNLSQIIRDKQASLKSILVLRRMGNGSYAEVVFPRTVVSANQIILLDGDKISWR